MNSRQLAFRAATILIVLVFVASGVGNLIHHEHIATDMQIMGYPQFFMTILGTWKVLGALAVALPGLPRLKEWAYAGMVFDLSGGVISRGVSGFDSEHMLPPLLVCALVLTSWALRPASRRIDPRRDAPRGMRFVAPTRP